MNGISVKRIGRLVWNDNIIAYDIEFPDGSTWGGLAVGQLFEVLNVNHVWVQTRLMCNWNGYFLQGVDFFPGMLARI